MTSAAASTSRIAAAVDALLAEHVAGRTLPQAAYLDPDLYAAEMDRVFGTSWLFVSSSAEIGVREHLTWSVGTDSVVLARGADGVLHAHHNVCRHRGSRIRPDGHGTGAALVCGYHNWAYGPDGTLRGAPHMGPGHAVERGRLALQKVHLREVAGLVFVCFADRPPPFDAAATAIGAHLAPYRPEATEVIARHSYRVRANWKLLVENNRECYHCGTNHAEFCLSNYELGVTGDTRTNPRYAAELARQRASWAQQGLATEDVSFPAGEFFRVARMPLKAGYLTESLSGELVAPLLGDLAGPEVGSVRVVTLPNSWSHVNADYVMTTRLTPVDVATTDVEVVFLVREGATGQVDVDEVSRVWTVTSEQDWELCEANARGVGSRAYRPGPLSPITENSVAGFHDWYLRTLVAG